MGVELSAAEVVPVTGSQLNGGSALAAEVDACEGSRLPRRYMLAGSCGDAARRLPSRAHCTEVLARNFGAQPLILPSSNKRR